MVIVQSDAIKDLREPLKPRTGSRDIYEDGGVGQGLLDGSWHLQIVDREILTTAKLMVNE